MRNSASIVIDRRITDVFKLTNDHVAEWSIIVVEDEVIDETADRGVGTTFRTVTEENGNRMEFDGVTTRHDPPYLNAVQLTGKSFDLDVEYVFEDVAGKTRVTQTSNVRGKGLFRVLLMLFGWLMTKSSCRATEKELESLKAFCEGYSGEVN